MTVSMLERARRYHALGFSVFPLDHPDEPKATDPDDVGKVPAVMSWKPFQVNRATDADLELWFGNGHRRNLALVMGAISKMVAVDTDTAEGEAWAVANLPDTPFKTRSAKGFHRLFQHPGVKVPTKAKLRPGARSPVACRERRNIGNAIEQAIASDTESVHQPDYSRAPQRAARKETHVTDIVHSRGGRPVGRTGEKTLSARRWARSIVETDWYHQSVIDRLKAGTLPPAIEALILQYAHGHPRQHIDIDVTAHPDLRGLSREELAERAERLAAELRARKALPDGEQSAIDAIDVDEVDTEQADTVPNDSDDPEPIH